ncbi:hypothetical protein BO94DRAFT_300227 [Aspergillus sclerotioniger CBS 115572]|uniref:Zn(2)-C6 fungal-type domain-containing protein n=1 Tax=Aspergillus sclerotioniger CBS 115572 TaxID=1450535 RepID=A0A317V413_9EURO|nr:hypothetical protein BO94DRAFT_300227 [Aspergillus sclerotioniger CBS 115572]PWY69013.1 hypothetical protein BO94DRAFT_300227 [Aspergillus sclerotioniger CBS 115572]
MASSLRAARRMKTCQQCRTRKVRCDGRRGTCGNCDRLQFTCSFQGVNTSLGRPGRLRARRACTRCHSLKVRCSGHAPACVRCQKRGRECIYSSPAAGNVAPKNDLVQNAVVQEPSCPDGVVDEQGSEPIGELGPFKFPDRQRLELALNVFFTHIHPLPGYAFLHRASLHDRLDREDVDMCLLLSITAISILLTDTDPLNRRYAIQCITKAEEDVTTNLGQPSIMRTQALLLVIRCKMCIGDYTLAFAQVAMLSRMAFSLRLNYQSSGASFLAIETRRRLMWAIYMLDTHWAAGLLEFTTCPADAIHVPLPCREENFELDIRPSREVQLHSISEIPGLLAGDICVAYLRDQILRSTKKYAADANTPSGIMHGIHEIENQLQALYRRLPLSDLYSRRNLRLRAHSPWLCRYAFLHLLWHQCHCDLYRCLTPALVESIPDTTLEQLSPTFLLQCQDRCAFHAEKVADIITSLLQLGAKLPVLPMEIAVWAYQSIRLLIHTARELTRERLVAYANSCSEMIRIISDTSPAVQQIGADLNSLIKESGEQKAAPKDYESGGVMKSMATPRHILSIHNLISRSVVVDDTEELPLPDGHSAAGLEHHNESSGLDGQLPTLSRFDVSPFEGVWLLDGNVVDGWEGQAGFDLIRQMQWDGMGY